MVNVDIFFILLAVCLALTLTFVVCAQCKPTILVNKRSLQEGAHAILAPEPHATLAPGPHLSSTDNQTLSELFPRVVYINLDKRTDRNQEILAEFKRVGIYHYERFAGVEHANGAIGCSESHLQVLKLAKARNYAQVLVLEDDAKFLLERLELLQILSKLNSSKVSFDVCLLGYNTPNLYPSDHDFLYKIKDAQTTSAYLVQAHYFDTLIQCWETALNLFKTTNNAHKYTCDQSWKILQRKHKWFCFNPRLVKQRASYSDIQNGYVNYNV